MVVAVTGLKSTIVFSLVTRLPVFFRTPLSFSDVLSHRTQGCHLLCPVHDPHQEVSENTSSIVYSEVADTGLRDS